jgi:N-acyl-D-amino-acid deacylase
MNIKPTRREVLRNGASAAAGLALFPTWNLEAVAEFDLVIRNGTILDGTGGPAWTGDVGIIGDTIGAIGAIAPEQAKKTLDASGKVVAPGFIDIHSHSDWSILRYPTAASRVHDGITTEVTGNCGSSMAPIWGAARDELAEELKADFEIDVTWTGVASFLDSLDEHGISVNHALLIGQGGLRQATIGLEDRRLTDDELKSVLRRLSQGLDEGAFGLSTGLEYVPGQFTPTDEIVALAGIVARRDGLYASHIRSELSGLLGAIDEAIRIGRLTGIRVEVSHLKAAGVPNWPKQRAALDLIASARAAGVPVLADAYPYPAYSTTLQVFVPAWAREGGWKGLAGRLVNPEERDRIRNDTQEIIIEDPGSWDLVVISGVRSSENQALVGRNIEEVAEGWSVEPVDAALRLLEEEDGGVSIIGHGMSPRNVEMVLAHPLVMIGSDGNTMAPEGPAAKTRPHPRSYGTYSRVLGHFTRDRGLFDLATAVKKMTSMPADQVGISDRGRIARGKKADIVVFDASTIKDVATFDDPQRYPTGIHHVLVNGEAVISDGRHTGARPGRALRKI